MPKSFVKRTEPYFTKMTKCGFITTSIPCACPLERIANDLSEVNWEAKINKYSRPFFRQSGTPYLIRILRPLTLPTHAFVDIRSKNMFVLLYSFWWWAMVLISIGFVVCLAILARSDCDLVLNLYCRWGKKPSQVLPGKVVWVTGASSGIGEALCYALARCGCVLVLSARREQELRRVLKMCIGKEKIPVAQHTSLFQTIVALLFINHIQREHFSSIVYIFPIFHFLGYSPTVLAI